MVDEEKAKALGRDILNDLIANDSILVKKIVEVQQRCSQIEIYAKSAHKNGVEMDKRCTDNIKQLLLSMKKLEKSEKDMKTKLRKIILYGKSHNELYDSKLFRFLRWCRLIP